MHLGAASVPGNSGQASGKEPRRGVGGAGSPAHREGRSTPKPPPPLPGRWVWALMQEAGRWLPAPRGSDSARRIPTTARKVRTICRPEGKAREKPLGANSPAQAGQAGHRPQAAALPWRLLRRGNRGSCSRTACSPTGPPASPLPPAFGPTGVGEPGPAPARAHLSCPLPRRPIGHIPDKGPTRGVRAFVSRHPTASWSAEPDMEAKRQEIRFCIFFLIKRHL